MTYEGLLNCIAECDELATQANDKSIREKSAELAEIYRGLADKAKGRDPDAELGHCAASPALAAAEVGHAFARRPDAVLARGSGFQHNRR